MRKVLTRIAGAFMLLAIGSSTLHAQMTGAYSVPGNFASLAAAINSLNLVGVGTGGATITIAAAHTETAPVGGYTLTATGTAGDPIVFQKSGVGANPLITAFGGGTATPATAIQNGVFVLAGSDYVTFDGIDITDPNTANPATMEFGYGLFAASVTNGCQYNTIKNCVITLNRLNNAIGTGASAAGSRGINVAGATHTAQTTVLTTITSTTGANSYNKFYNNLIQNCNIGISLYGGSTQTYYDTNNDVGGVSAATSNTIINYGGGAVSSAAYGVYTMYQQNVSVSNNIINNNNGSGVNHGTTLYGIYLGAATSANSSVLNNTLTLSNGAAAGACHVINNASGTTAASNTVEISNNVIANCNNTIVTSGAFYGILNSGSPANVNINNNTFTNNSVAGTATGAFQGITNSGAPTSLNINNNTFTATTTKATSGIVYHIYQTGAPTASISIQNNKISWSHNGTTSHSGAFYGIYNTNSGAASTLNVTGNDFSDITRTTVSGAGSLFFINLAGNQSQRYVNANTWTNLSLNHANAQYLISNAGTVTNTITVNSNSIIGTYSRGLATSNALYCIYNNGVGTSTAGVRESAYNNFSGISATVAGTGQFFGIFESGGTPTAPYGRVLIHDNLISDVNIVTSGSVGQFQGINFTGNVGSNGVDASAIYSNTITNVKFSGTFYGYYIQPVNADPARSNQIYSNEVSNVTTANTLYGMYLISGANTAPAHLLVYRNKIAALTCTSTSGAVNGIYTSSSYYTDIYNNLIGLLYSDYNAGSAPSVAGIYVNSGLTNLWHNTIYLDAGSSSSTSTLTITAAHFASAAAYVSTTHTVEMKNNIFINKSVPKGVGKTAALWKSTFAFNTHATTSDNNLFYAGVPSASNVVYYDGVLSFQGMANYKLIFAPRDTNSVYETATPFLSTVASSTNFLHLDPSQYTLAKSNASAIPGISDDYDTDIRQGNPGYTGGASSPDIGADEFNLCIPPAKPVSISPLSNYVVCGSNGGVTSLSVTGSGTINWYNVPAGGSSLGTGSSFTTPFVTTNTVFYASATTASCSSDRIAFNLVVLPKPSVSIMTPTNSICEGASLPLIAQGDAVTYTWTQSGNTSPGIVVNPTATTSYTVVGATAYGCTNRASQQIVVNPSPSVTAGIQKTSVCKDEPVTLDAKGAQTYVWTSNNLLATGYTVEARANIATTYTVTGTDNNGCSSTATVALKVNNCVGIAETAAGSLQAALYPNPTHGVFTLELNNDLDKTIELLDLTGRVVMTQTSGDAAIRLDISQFANGVYFLKVRSNTTVELVKIVKH